GKTFFSAVPAAAVLLAAPYFSAKAAQADAAAPVVHARNVIFYDNFKPEEPSRLDAPRYASRKAGILIISQPGGIEWREKIRQAAEPWRRQMPVETISGAADLRALEAAAAKLDSYGVKRIIVVPLFITSYSEALNQTRYLLGLRRDPSPTFLKGQHESADMRSARRLQSRTPLVMTTGLEGDEQAVAAFAGKLAQFKSGVSGPVSLVIAAAGPSADSTSALAQAQFNSIAAALASKYKLADARAVLLRADTTRMDAPFPALGLKNTVLPPARTGHEAVDASRAELRKTVRELSKISKVLVLGYSLDAGELDKIIAYALEGDFFAWGGTVSPDGARVSAWLKSRIERGLKMKPLPRYFEPVSLERKKHDDNKPAAY
ncbi:MAG: hypothetical protein PHP45_02440, partial [Elusimicrobiales bacterium]|nr:hypothetical protein [Elusimicrobiales bacterium]